MKYLYIVVLLLFPLVCLSQIVSPCGCAQKSVLHRYWQRTPLGTDPITVPGWQQGFPKFDFNGYTYVLVESCIFDLDNDVRNRSDRIDIGFAPNYYPIKLAFDPDELHNMYSNWISCFDKDNAYECIMDAIERWSSICTQPTNIKATIEWRKQQVGEFGIIASYDLAYWSPRMSALAVATKQAHVGLDQSNNLESYWNLPKLAQPDRVADGIHFNMIRESNLSTSCPCSECNAKPSFNFCKIFQHELGHLFGLYHLMTTCPIPTESNATMNQYSIPCNDTPNNPDACHLDLTCNDLCAFCKLLCKNDCANVTSVFDLSTVVSAESFSIAIYPNPVLNTLHIDVSGTVNGIGTCRIFDVNGNSRYQYRFAPLEGHFSVDLSRLNLERGAYFIMISDDNECNMTKILIQ